MDKKLTVCKKCKKDSDVVRLTALAGDEKKLQPGTKISQWKCVRCKRILVANERIFLVTPLQKTFRCPHCNQEYPCGDLNEAERGHIKNCLYQITDPNKRFKEKLKRSKNGEK